MLERVLPGIKNRVLQHLARSGPGAESFRVWCHRKRGVVIGEGAWIGYDSIIETAFPSKVRIGDRVILGARTTIIAHFDNPIGVTIEDDVFIGPCVLILPGVTIGKGAVVTAGSVLTRSVPSMTMVQGNPARPVATCGIPLGLRTSYKQFRSRLRPLTARSELSGNNE